MQEAHGLGTILDILSVSKQSRLHLKERRLLTAGKCTQINS